MDVSVSLLPPSHDQAAHDVAVVIDVLRATSVMATAIANGAKHVVTCQEVAQAWTWKQRLGESTLLCGERQCRRIDGFDLGNSPGEYTADVVSGRTLVLTTTNGTRAIHAVQRSRKIITAGFLNFSSVVESLRHAGSVALVCAGTDGVVTGEDVLLAGAIAVACQERFAVNVHGEGAMTAIDAWHASLQNPLSLADQLRETAGGKNLVRFGFQADIGRCAKTDLLRVVPMQVTQSPPTFAADPC